VALTGTPTTGTSRTVPSRLRVPERVDWALLGPEFLEQWGRPRGKLMPEHLSIYGQTGSGKSYFEAWALSERAAARGSHVVALVTKPADSTMAGMGWPVVERWPPGYGKPQVIYWAKAPGKPGNPEGIRKQRASVAHLLDSLWQPDANIILSFDELAYVVEDLRLRSTVTRYYREARALGITIVATTQRPAGVVRQMHSEAGWKVVFAPEDEEDARRMAEVLGNRRHYIDVLMDLDRERFEFLIARKLTSEAYISHLPPPKRAPDTARR
jgi:hypothetical protein